MKNKSEKVIEDIDKLNQKIKTTIKREKKRNHYDFLTKISVAFVSSIIVLFFFILYNHTI